MIPKNPSVWNAQNPNFAQMVTNQCVIRQQISVFPVKMDKVTVSTANTSQAKQDVWSIKMIPKNPSVWNAQNTNIVQTVTSQSAIRLQINVLTARPTSTASTSQANQGAIRIQINVLPARTISIASTSRTNQYVR